MRKIKVNKFYVTQYYIYRKTKLGKNDYEFHQIVSICSHKH